MTAVMQSAAETPTLVVPRVKTKPARALGFDVLRIVAILAVIVLHVSANDLNEAKQFYGSATWWSGDVAYALCCFCVPAFFLLSGALVLNYRERMSTRDFLMKRLTKIAIPFALWSGIYLYLRATWGNNYLGIISIHSIGDLVPYTITGPAEYHLWFFYYILGLYLVTPILSVFIISKQRAMLWYLAVLCTIQSMGAFLVSAIFHISLYAGIPLATSYVEYFVLGWLLRGIHPKAWQQAILYGAAALSVMGMILYTTAMNSASATPTNQDAFAYEGPGAFLVALSLFIGVQQINWGAVFRARWMQRSLTTLSSAVFGVYLIHILVMYFVMFYGPQYVNVAGLFPAVLSAIEVAITFVLSATIVLILQRIPVVRFLVP